METERLQKILARAGYGSRRGCEKLIARGRVAVDGRLATLGDKADPQTQRVTVDGVPLKLPQGHLYIALHKPRRVISTVQDPHGRPTVRDLIPLQDRLYPVGRLDFDSEGLILMTNDGDLTQRLTHPRYGHIRVYRVLVAGEPDPKALQRWKKGITLDDRPARCKNVVVESTERGQTWLRMTVKEGRNHLVRRMVAALGYPAQRVIRVQMGPIMLSDLPLRKWRYLTQGEIRTLEKEVGVDLHPTTPSTPSTPSRPSTSRSRRRGRSKRSSRKRRS